MTDNNEKKIYYNIFSKIIGSKKTAYAIIGMIFVTAVGFFFRIFFLGNVFISSDNAELAVRILKKPGFIWMALESYGIIVSLWDKLLVSLFALLGINVTEFWWKLPVAIAGTLQIPLSFLFMRRLKASVRGAFFASFLTAMLPIHMFQSRYLWGYEIFGTFFLMLALWTLLNFFERPSVKTGITASVFSGLYIISHGYFTPFFALLAAMIFLYSPIKNGIVKRFFKGLKLYITNFTWLFLAIPLPLTIRPVIHMLNKKTSPGFYLFEYIPDIISSCGIFIFVLILIAFAIHIAERKRHLRDAGMLLAAGILYMAPLVLGAPHGITVTKGYFLISIVFLIFYAVLVVDKYISKYQRTAIVTACIILVFTGWGVIESLFLRDKLIDPSMVTQGRGEIYDTGVKAAGFFIRKNVPESAKIFAMHDSIEEPIMYYYFNRDDFAYNDLSGKEYFKKFDELKYITDVVLCSEIYEPYVQSSGLFVRRCEIKSDVAGQDIIIYSKPVLPVPGVEYDIEKLNAEYDAVFSWNDVILDNFLNKGRKTFGRFILDGERQEKNRNMIKKYLYFLYD